MRLWITKFLKRLSLAQRFMLASLVIFVAGMIGLGAWIGQQIASAIVHHTAATTALYVDSFIAPHVQELARSDTLTPEHVATLRELLQNTPLGQQIATLKVWDIHGRLVYSTDPAEIGAVFPVQGGLERAWNGEVAARISDLQDAENARERERDAQLLEIYSPVRLRGTEQIIAVAEFYQKVDGLQREIGAAQQRSWLVVGGVTLLMYLLLAGFIGRASDTIGRQELALRDQVARLTELLAQNVELHERVRRAATRTTALNERFLRRISAELHDGPAQELSLALLRLDHVGQPSEADPNASGQPREEPLQVVQSSLGRALQELRAISAGLGVPQLAKLSLPETVARVVRAHERRTGTKVATTLGALPDQAPLPVKITLYRFIQEALSNAYRHAGGVDQQVRVSCAADTLHIEIADGGAGFVGEPANNGVEHLGLIGMRERVESLGGQFQVNSRPGQGTTVIADLALQVAEELDG